MLRNCVTIPRTGSCFVHGGWHKRKDYKLLSETLEHLNMFISFSFCLDAGRLAKSQYLEVPVTGHLVSVFSWFPWYLEQMLGWFPTVPSCHYMLLM